MKLKWLLLVVSLAASTLMFAPVLSAQSYGDHYYRSDYDNSNTNDDFVIGYRQGYDHGFADMRAGLTFNFAHSEAYQNGSSDFQSGYEQGYTDAFNQQPSQFADHRSDYRERENRNMAPVEAFDDTGFRGRVLPLRMGQYNSIDLDDVQSLRINADVRVILFNERNFEGRSVTVTSDTPSLRYMQNRAFWPFGIMRHHTGSIIIEPLR